MALPAGRVGVKRTSVDWQGNVKGNGGSSDTYTKQQIDSKFGGLTFRDNEGTPQVKTSEGEWVNFNSGGGIGFNIPNPTTEGLAISSYATGSATIDEGGYQIVDGICYVDITITVGANLARGNDIVTGFPALSNLDGITVLNLLNLGTNGKTYDMYITNSGSIRFNAVSKADTIRVMGVWKTNI